MICPFCGTDEDRVIDSRPAREGKAIRRRRECSACGNRFTTYESPEEMVTFVLKSDGSREPFDRTKVYRGLVIACNKRPVTKEMLESLTFNVEKRALALEGQEIPTQQIGRWILEELLPVDEVAYVRFASVFNRFENVEEFLAELARIRHSARTISQSN